MNCCTDIFMSLMKPFMGSIDPVMNPVHHFFDVVKLLKDVRMQGSHVAYSQQRVPVYLWPKNGFDPSFVFHLFHSWPWSVISPRWNGTFPQCATSTALVRGSSSGQLFIIFTIYWTVLIKNKDTLFTSGKCLYCLYSKRKRRSFARTRLIVLVPRQYQMQTKHHVALLKQSALHYCQRFKSLLVTSNWLERPIGQTWCLGPSMQDQVCQRATSQILWMQELLPLDRFVYKHVHKNICAFLLTWFDTSAEAAIVSSSDIDASVRSLELQLRGKRFWGTAFWSSLIKKDCQFQSQGTCSDMCSWRV